MATERATASGDVESRHDPIRRALDALFPEARQLQRRRRLRTALLLLLVTAIVIGIVRASGGGHHPPEAVVRVAPPSPASVALPAAGHFYSLAVEGGRLTVLGGPEYSLPVSGNVTSLVAGRAAGTCHAAAVNPHTLALGPIATANCGDPALYGEHVLPIAYLLRSASSPSGLMIAVRIARADPVARDGYTLGPVVTKYPECSDCQIAWIYGDGSLWIYNPLAHPPRGPAALIRISTRTGAVLERWAAPEIVRALLAVDANGLWLSPSIESGAPDLRTPSQLRPYRSLYRVTPGDSSLQPILTEGGEGARWLLASGDTASAAIDNGHGYAAVWTFAPRGRPIHGPTLNDTQVGTELGTGGPTVAGNDKIGFYNVTLGNGTESVIQVQPGSRHEQTIATIRLPHVNLDDGTPTGVTLSGSFFFLDAPTTQSAGSRDLHRITPP